jgi:hypothetical protein
MSTTTEIIDIKAEELADKLPELEKAMSYSLADAIREGSTNSGQCVGGWTDEYGNTCALSAALVAVKARRML